MDLYRFTPTTVFSTRGFTKVRGPYRWTAVLDIDHDVKSYAMRTQLSPLMNPLLSHRLRSQHHQVELSNLESSS